MKIIEVLTKDTIQIGLEARDKQDLLEKITDLAMKSGKISNRAAVLKSIIEREKIMSTGIGKNICLPHAKTEHIEGPVAALATLSKPVDFQSLDGEPVNICFLLLGKENNVGMHLRLLSKISRFLNNDEFREKILNSKTPDEIINHFESIDE